MTIRLRERGRSSVRVAAGLGTFALLLISGPAAAAASVNGAATAESRPAATAPERPRAHKATRARAKGTVASTVAPTASPVANRPKLSAPGRAGMVVGIDPASGELGPPTAEQLRALQGLNVALERSTEGLVVITRPDGSQHVNLQGRFRAYSVVTLDADGTPRVQCVEGRAQAMALAGGGASPASLAPAHALRVVGPREE